MPSLTDRIKNGWNAFRNNKDSSYLDFTQIGYSSIYRPDNFRPMSSYKIIKSDELYHHGILGQKWGVRRFQNSDGSLTSEGKERYGKSDGVRAGNVKKALKIGAAVAVTGLAVYGAYRYYDAIQDNKYRQEQIAGEIKRSKSKDVLDFIQQSSKDRSAVRSIRDEKLERLKSVTTNKTEKPFNPKDFTFRRYEMVRPDGSTSHIELPTNPEAYAVAFAKDAAKHSESFGYWYKYVLKEITKYDPSLLSETKKEELRKMSDDYYTKHYS